MRFGLNKFKKTLRKKGSCFHLFLFILDYNYGMRFVSRKSVLFGLLILSFSLLNAQGMPGGNPPGGQPPAGPHPPAGNENPGNFPPPPPKDPENIINYRGNRTYSENLPLKIIQTKCTRKEGELVFIEIFFNQSINPRSMNEDSIYINDQPLPKKTRFLYNRRGDTLKLITSMQEDEFSLKVQNINSFSGYPIEPAFFEIDLEDEDEFFEFKPEEDGELPDDFSLIQ
jgi:hypothetical protein